MLKLTTTFIEAAIRAAGGLSPNARVGVPIPEMNGYWVIQHGRWEKPHSVIATLEANGRMYDVYCFPHH